MLDLDISNISFKYDRSFYPILKTVLANYNSIIRLYNLTRNYLTKKRKNLKKLKINLGNSVLAKGWSESKIEEYKTTIFKKDDKYYLGIFTSASAVKNFISTKKDSITEEYYEKIVYRNFPKVSQNIPRLTVKLDEVQKYFENNNNGSYYLNDNFSTPFEITQKDINLQSDVFEDKKKYQIEYLRATKDKEGYEIALKHWIEFCKKFLKTYNGTVFFNYDSLDSKTYTRLDQFYRDVQNISYHLEFENISSIDIKKSIDDGDLLLFQIYNKDFSDGSSGKKNLFSLYWIALFSDLNLESRAIQLNGGAEIYYREQQIKNSYIHLKDSQLLSKFDVLNRPIKSEIYKELDEYLNTIDKEKLSNEASEKLSNEALIYIDNGLLKTKTAKFEIIKDRRFRENQLFFHVPITLNFNSYTEENINSLVNYKLKENEQQNIIGIDRGENNLLYICIIDMEGNIIKQESLNNLGVYRSDPNCTIQIPYNDLLTARELERAEARLKWQSIEKIKDLKNGYLSHVVYKISQLIKEYNAIVVLEDLNPGFKRGRLKFEKQVYQKFEMALMNKLTSLSFKEIEFDEVGGVLNPYQLCAPVDSYEKLKGQNGIVFYVNPAYTSSIDPTTGLANLFNHDLIDKHYNLFIDNLISLEFQNNEVQEFIFKFKYDRFSKAELLVLKTTNRTIWEVSTRGQRLQYIKGDKRYKPTNITEEMIDLFVENKIDFSIGCNILVNIRKLDDVKYERVVKKIISLFKLTLQLRQKTDNGDHIISPVKNRDGYYYDSSKVKDNILPDNADANGAFNIARKGLLYINKLKKSSTGKASISISNKQWFDFIMLENREDN